MKFLLKPTDVAVDGIPQSNAHGVMHKRNLLQTVMAPIPDLRAGINDPADPSAFQGNFFLFYCSSPSDLRIDNVVSNTT